MCRYQKRRRGEGEDLLRKGLLAAWHSMRFRALNRDGHHPTYAEVFRTRVSTHGWDPDEAATRPVAAYRKKESARV